ncbi:MAG TPA: DUF805 domain-containing protein [Telluria sp.]
MSNVYAAPSTTFSDSDPDVAAKTTLFAFNGRIGRARWIAYTLALWMLGSIVLSIVLQLLGLINIKLVESVGFGLSLALWCIPALVSRRRLQDLGLSAYYLLGLVVPFVNLYFFFMLMFKRGDEGSNEYGPVPAPNDRVVFWLAMIIPGIMLVGILAAIALPAYKSYTDKARAHAASVSPPSQR